MMKRIVGYKRGFFLGMALFAAAALFGAGRREAAGGGGELRYGLASEIPVLDPLDSGTTADARAILFNVYEGLVKPDTDGNLTAALAKSFIMGRGGLEYIFVLREDVRFHDGSLVEPEDVVFTLTTAKERRYTGFSDIEAIEAVSTTGGGREIRVTLARADPEFLPYLTIGIVPRNNADREKNPIGTGPYKVERYTPQQSLVLKRNPDYWGKAPYLDTVTVVFLAGSNSVPLALRGGGIDAATVSGADIEQIDTRTFDVVEGYSNMVQIFALNNAVKPLDDLRVREAVNYAVDIPDIINTAFYGRGEPSGSPLIPGLKSVYDASLRDPYPVDPARARSLLAEAGYPAGFPLEITVPSNYAMHVDTAQVLVNQLAAAGISATIKLVDWATWLTDVYRGRNFAATIISFDGSTVPLSPRSFLSRYLSTSGSNFINFNNPRYDAAYNAALTETDGAKRAALYKEAQRVISESAASVYIQDMMSFQVVRNTFKGVVNYPLNVVDFSVIYQTQ
jgi:peptide/nickel transport system substrate-binding protein